MQKNENMKITRVGRGYIVQTTKEVYCDNDPVGPGDYYPDTHTVVYENFEQMIAQIYVHFQEDKPK